MVVVITMLNAVPSTVYITEFWYEWGISGEARMSW